MASLLEPLRRFAQELTANFAASRAVPAQPEDQLKGPTQQLLHWAGEEFDLDVIARVEALTNLAVRPDLGVSVGDLSVGHLELKAPGKGARAEAFTQAHDRDQFKKLKDHPNLIYTDGNEWALYRQGERVGPVVRCDGDVRTTAATPLARPQPSHSRSFSATSFFGSRGPVEPKGARGDAGTADAAATRERRRSARSARIGAGPAG